MANEWIWASGKACYNSVTPGYALGENGIVSPGKAYTISFEVTGMTQGKLVIPGLLDENNQVPEFTEDGEYSGIYLSISNNITFVGEEYLGNVFDGCIDNVELRSVPLYEIEDLDGNIVYVQSLISQSEGSGQFIQYGINWDLVGEGCYVIVLNDMGIRYESDCLSVKVTHDCTLQLTWTNDENAFGFNYSDLSFIQSLRVEGKKWKPTYSKSKNVFTDSLNNKSILKSTTDKEEILTVKESPEYIHDALSIGVEHDDLYIDGVKYTNEETEYTPAWRKSSQLAPVEVVVIKNQDLTNNNCG